MLPVITFDPTRFVHYEPHLSSGSAWAYLVSPQLALFHSSGDLIITNLQTGQQATIAICSPKFAGSLYFQVCSPQDESGAYRYVAIFFKIGSRLKDSYGQTVMVHGFLLVDLRDFPQLRYRILFDQSSEHAVRYCELRSPFEFIDHPYLRDVWIIWRSQMFAGAIVNGRLVLINVVGMYLVISTFSLPGLTLVGARALSGPAFWNHLLLCSTGYLPVSTNEFGIAAVLPIPRTSAFLIMLSHGCLVLVTEKDYYAATVQTLIKRSVTLDSFWNCTAHGSNLVLSFAKDDWVAFLLVDGERCLKQLLARSRMAGALTRDVVLGECASVMDRSLRDYANNLSLSSTVPDTVSCHWQRLSVSYDHGCVACVYVQSFFLDVTSWKFVPYQKLSINKSVNLHSPGTTLVCDFSLKPYQPFIPDSAQLKLLEAMT